MFHLQGIAGQRGLQGVMGKAGPQVSTANRFKVNPGYSARFSVDKKYWYCRELWVPEAPRAYWVQRVCRDKRDLKVNQEDKDLQGWW